MSSPKVHRLGDLQLKIMKILWEKGDAAVSDVHEALAHENLAYTTVATMLRKMEVKGLVKHTQDERRFLYRPAVKEEAVSRKMADDLLDRLFEGSLANMVSHLLRSREVSSEEITQLEKLISDHKNKAD